MLGNFFDCVQTSFIDEPSSQQVTSSILDLTINFPPIKQKRLHISSQNFSWRKKGSSEYVFCECF